MREAIEDLLDGYAEAIDDGQIERWPGFFIENGTYQIITRASHDAGLPIGLLYCDSRGMMEDHMGFVVNAIDKVLMNADDEGIITSIRGEVNEFMKQFVLYPELG